MAVWGQSVAVALCCVLFGWGLVSCSTSNANDDGDASGPGPTPGTTEFRLRLEPVTSGLAVPLAATHAGDARLFIVERPGRLRIWRNGELLTQPFLDLTSQVRAGGEQGLLSVAFHPNYGVPQAPGQGLFWVNYTNLDGDTVIARYTVSSEDPDRAAPESERVLLMIEQPFVNH